MIRHAISPRLAMRREAIKKAPPQYGKGDRPMRRSIDEASAILLLVLLGRALGCAEDRFVEIVRGRNVGGAIGGEESIFEHHHAAGRGAVVLAVAVDGGDVGVGGV